MIRFSPKELASIKAKGTTTEKKDVSFTTVKHSKVDAFIRAQFSVKCMPARTPNKLK